MTKVIGLTGSHNTGKSFLLRHFAELPESAGIVIDLVSAPRSVQAELGKTLEEVVSVQGAIASFQKRILEFKRQHLEKLIAAKPAVIITDRSPVDIVAYAELWVERHQIQEESAEWMADLHRQAFIDIQAYSNIMFFPVLPDIPFTAEAMRGSQVTQLRLHELCSALVDEAAQQVPVTTLHHSSLSYRLRELSRLTNP